MKGKAFFSEKTVVVLGMYGSGTSMMAGILSVLGVNMGKNLMPAYWSNPLGHFESMEFVNLNEEILRRAGGSLDRPPSETDILAHSEIFSFHIKKLVGEKRTKIWGWNDPRTSLTIELYIPYLNNPYFILCHRDPLDIAESLRQRYGKRIEEGLKLCQIYEGRILNFIKRHPELKILHVYYREFIKDPEKGIKLLIEFLGIDPSREQFSEALSLILPKGKSWQTGFQFQDLVSIVMPVFNKLEYTERCLNALYQVTSSNLFELIVVNNASTDGTKEFLDRFRATHSNMKVVHNKDNAGFARACNQGARIAKGKYLLFLNNDVVPLAGWLEQMLKVIKEERHTGIVGSKLLFPNNTIQHAGVIIYDFPFPVFPCHIYYQMPGDIKEANTIKEYQAVTGACMLISRDIFQKIGGFDEGFVNGYEDVDLCFRVRQRGYRIMYTPYSMLYHFEGQSEGRHKYEERNFKRLNKKWQGKIKPDKEIDSLSIIIVTYNSSKDLTNCLDSIYLHTSLPYEVVLVDNNSSDNTRMVMKSYKEKTLFFCKLIMNNKNLGFSRACNQGFKESRGKYIVLLNPDTVVTPGWDKRMIAHFKEEDVVAVGPISNYAYGKQNLDLYLNGLSLPNGTFDIIHISEAIYKHYKGKSMETRLLIGFCIMIKREIFERLGGLDEDLFLGNDDLELSWRLRLHGYRLLIAPDVFIYHKGQASFQTRSSHETDSLVQESTDRLAEKLLRHYGSRNVPIPEELWGIDWFRPSERYKSIFRKIDKKVSIVIVNYKQVEDSIQCLESIYKSNYKRFQVIVVDNDSQDGSVEKILDWANKKGKRVIHFDRGYMDFPGQSFNQELILMESKENLGFAGGNNMGIRYGLECGAEYVWLLNNDTVIEKDALTYLIRSFFIDEKIGLVSSKIYCYGDRSQVEYDGTTPLLSGKEDKRDDSLKIVDFAPACSLIISSMAFKDIGLLNEDYFLYFEDNDFCKRARDAGWMILYNPNSKIYHKSGSSIGRWLKTPISAYYAPRNLLYHNARSNISECFRFLEDDYWKQLKKSADCLKGFVEGIKDFVIGKMGRVSPEQLDLKRWDNWPDDGLKKAAMEFINKPESCTLSKFLALCQGLIFKKQSLEINTRKKAKVYCMEGEKLFEKGNVGRAISLFEKALKLDPLCGQAYNNLAAIYWQTQDKERSLYYIEKAVELSPSDLDVLWNYKQIMMGLGFKKEAQRIEEVYRIICESQQ